MSELLAGEPGKDLASMFASYGPGGLIAGVLLYIFYRMAQRVMDAQTERDKWSRDSRDRMNSAINNLALKTESQTAAIYAMTEWVGRLPCVAHDGGDENNSRKTQRATRSIPKALEI